MAHLFQVGAGSGGIAVLDLLVRDPRITRVTLVEPDVYKPHNVHRHLFAPDCVGRLKADLAAQWVRSFRPDVAIETIAADLMNPESAGEFEKAAAECDVGVCAVDNEPAKYAFDTLMRKSHKRWTLGEVLSGGIGGWVHRFTPDGACYGCVASHLQREVTDAPPAPPPDYANPGAAIAETTIPASKTSIAVIAGLQAAMTLDMLEGEGIEQAPAASPGDTPRESASGTDSGPRPAEEFTSVLLTLKRVPGLFDEAYRPFRFRISRSAACLICSTIPAPAAGEDLDVALDQALARLGND